jgi:uncharacterized protein YeaO (DUF488 family)
MAIARKRRPTSPGAKRRQRRTVIRIKRAYDALAGDDGLRILVDRLWPRGLSKKALKLDAWPRDLAPSNDLRRWYNHDPARLAEFRRRYRAELQQKAESLKALRAALRGRKVTLVTATRDLALSHAQVLRELLTRLR